MALIIAEMSLNILSQHEVKNIWENSLQMPQKSQTKPNPSRAEENVLLSTVC